MIESKINPEDIIVIIRTEYGWVPSEVKKAVFISNQDKAEKWDSLLSLFSQVKSIRDLDIKNNNLAEHAIFYNYEHLEQQNKILQEEDQKQFKRIEILQQENQNLKEKAEKYDKINEQPYHENTGLALLQEVELNKSLQQENKKLEEEKKRLENRLYLCDLQSCGTFEVEIQRMIDERDTLKEKLDRIKNYAENYYDGTHNLLSVKTELKEILKGLES